MADNAPLRIEIDSSDAPRAVSALDNVIRASERLEAEAARLKSQLNDSFRVAPENVRSIITAYGSLGGGIEKATFLLKNFADAGGKVGPILERIINLEAQIEARAPSVAAARIAKLGEEAERAEKKRRAEDDATLKQQLRSIEQVTAARRRAAAEEDRLAESQRRSDRALLNLERLANQPFVVQPRAQAPQTAGAGLLAVGAAVQAAGAALTFNAVREFGEQSTDAALKIDSLRRALIAITGSSREADVQLQRLREIAKLPGLGFEEAVRGAVRLQAVGFSATDAERALKAFGKAIALTGGGPEQLNSITVQLAQLAGKGKVLAQDLKPIIEAAPAVGKALASIFGTVDSEQIQKQLERTGKSAQDFVRQLVGSLEKL